MSTSVEAALRDAARRLREAGSPSARLDAGRLLAAILARDAGWLLAHGDAVLGGEAAGRYEAALRRRAMGEPVAYITGSVGFYGREFAVDARVLIPRPESELLVELALAALRPLALGAAGDAAAGTDGPLVLDVGTGSGALAITLACEVPSLRCIALDVSAEALAVARDNAVLLGVAERIAFRQGDLLEALAPGERFACVVANLPYVESGAIALAPDPVSFEPRLALDGGADGLDVYRRLLARLPGHLEPGGRIFLEAGASTTPRLAALVEKAIPTAEITVHRDLQGHQRVVEA